MFHPVGSQPPSVYWRRRLAVVGSIMIVIVLLAVTIAALTSGGSNTPLGAGPSASPTGSTAPGTAGPNTSSSPSSRTRSSSSASAGASGTSTVPPTCSSSQLTVVAVVGKDVYHVGDQPSVEMRVTNNGSGPCVQDLGDPQIVLKVYNGESRVWGSHDCKVVPGIMNRTMVVNHPVLVSVNWSGLTSRPGCDVTRQRVGAGTYTLYASLSGHTGKVAQFTIV